MVRHWLQVLCLCMMALGLVACCSAAGPGHCRVLVVLQATKDVNPSRTGEALPTVVRFYQLKDIAALKKASYQDLWLHAPEVLGADLTDVQETIIYPSDRQTQVISCKDDAVYLAAGAFFRSPEGVTWRTYVKLPELGTCERCKENKPGGPYYFQIDGTNLRGSLEPLPSAR